MRIRKARLELGLSLSDVAGTDFSRAFLDQVELGRTHPSMRTLQIIAERLHRPIEYFLDDPANSGTALELLVTKAGARLRQGDPDQAGRLMTELLKRERLPPEVRARAQLLLAEADLRLGQVREAIGILQTAIPVSEQARWYVTTVELYDRMGTAHYLLRRPHDAARWWDRAMSLYQDAELADPLLKARILGHQANLHYVAGQPQEAIAAYQAAIEAAGQVLDMQALGGLYEGLAVSLQQIGQLGRALEYAQRSLRLFDTLLDLRIGARLRCNMAEILLEQRRIDEAETLFLEGAEQLRRVGDRQTLPLLLAGAAEAALERADLELAARRIDEALASSALSNDPLCRLTGERVAGRIAQARGLSAEARTHFEQAVFIALSVDSPMEQSRVTYDYAQVLEAQGDTSGAIKRYREAYEARRRALQS